MDLAVKNKEINDYLRILCKDIPDFLFDYANVKEMQSVSLPPQTADNGCVRYKPAINHIL